MLYFMKEQLVEMIRQKPFFLHVLSFDLLAIFLKTDIF